MNFSIHLEERLAAGLKRHASRSGRTRNALINEAVRQYLERAQRDAWPEELRDFEALDDLKPFESQRAKKSSGVRFP